MAGRILKVGAVLAVVAASYDASAAIGDLTGTSTPTVIIPETTPGPQTPAYPTPPIGTYGAGAVAPRARSLRYLRYPAAVPRAPRVVAPPIHH